MTKSGAQTTVPNDKGFIKNFANIYLHPCVVDEKPTFVYEKGLKKAKLCFVAHLLMQS